MRVHIFGYIGMETRNEAEIGGGMCGFIRKFEDLAGVERKRRALARPYRADESCGVVPRALPSATMVAAFSLVEKRRYTFLGI